MLFRGAWSIVELLKKGGHRARLGATARNGTILSSYGFSYLICSLKVDEVSAFVLALLPVA